MTTCARELEARLREMSKQRERIANNMRGDPENAYDESAFLEEAAALIAECEWRDIASAPKDGTMLDLFIPEPERDRVFTHDNPLTDKGESITIGFNNLDNDGEDEWKFAGWNWENDYFTEGSGVPTHWRPRPLPPPPTPELITGEVGEEKGETK